MYTTLQYIYLIHFNVSKTCERNIHCMSNTAGGGGGEFGVENILVGYVCRGTYKRDGYNPQTIKGVGALIGTGTTWKNGGLTNWSCKKEDLIVTE